MATYFSDVTVAAVQSEVRLRPEQVGALLTAPTYADDITARIAQESAYIALKLESQTALIDLALMGDSAKALATQWELYRVAASLYHSAGQLNEAYKNEALDYERRAAEIGALLMLSLSTIYPVISPPLAEMTGVTLSTAPNPRASGLPVVNGDYYA